MYFKHFSLLRACVLFLGYKGVIVHLCRLYVVGIVNIDSHSH